MKDIFLFIIAPSICFGLILLNSHCKYNFFGKDLYAVILKVMINIVLGALILAPFVCLAYNYLNQSSCHSHLCAIFQVNFIEASQQKGLDFGIVPVFIALFSIIIAALTWVTAHIIHSQKQEMEQLIQLKKKMQKKLQGYEDKFVLLHTIQTKTIDIARTTNYAKKNVLHYLIEMYEAPDDNRLVDTLRGLQNKKFVPYFSDDDKIFVKKLSQSNNQQIAKQAKILYSFLK